MKHDMLYVCLARTTKQEYANFCDIQCLKQYTGYIYRYSYNNVSYIGCTTDINNRKEEHKENKTNKFGRALKQYGYDSFEFEIFRLLFSLKPSEEFKEVDNLRNKFLVRFKFIIELIDFKLSEPKLSDVSKPKILSGSLDLIDISPAKALEPKIVDCGPLKISTCAISKRCPSIPSHLNPCHRLKIRRKN